MGYGLTSASARSDGYRNVKEDGYSPRRNLGRLAATHFGESIYYPG